MILIAGPPLTQSPLHLASSFQRDAPAKIMILPLFELEYEELAPD